MRTLLAAGLLAACLAPPASATSAVCVGGVDIATGLSLHELAVKVNVPFTMGPNDLVCEDGSLLRVDATGMFHTATCPNVAGSGYAAGGTISVDGSNRVWFVTGALTGTLHLNLTPCIAPRSTFIATAVFVDPP